MNEVQMYHMDLISARRKELKDEFYLAYDPEYKADLKKSQIKSKTEI